MATHRIYYDDCYLQNFEARVVSCLPFAPVQLESGTRPAWEVLLDRTAFYPTSGGQPHDIGKLGDANVLDVHEEGEEILHIVDRELETGAVDGCVQWPRRFDHMQQHTGQHLLSAMFEERFGLPTVSFHLGAELCTIDLRGIEPIQDVLTGAQRAANQVVFEDRPVNVRYGTADKLAQIGVRREVEREGILRAIEIEGADLQPCGGTHVKSTGQIGAILVRRCVKMRQDWRVEFVCGGRAERVAGRDFQLLRGLSERLSAPPEDISTALEKLQAERDTNHKRLRTALEELAEAHAKLMTGAGPAGASGDRVVALLVDESSGQLVFAQHAGAGKELPAVLKQVLEAVPGKGGGTRDFVRAKLTDAKRSSEALELAKKLVKG
jgi:alanyl-tRNA synthetase